MHPFAAGCPVCGTDLDAVRRKRNASRIRNRIALPSIGRETVDLLLLAIILLVLGVFAALYGMLLSLFVLWHSHRHGFMARRNIALAGAVLAILNLFTPGVL